jgi:hypothetical protein
MKKKKYRISRKQKKAEKKKIIRLTNKDMAVAGLTLTKREKKSLQFQVWIMAGVVYHKYNWTA